MDQELKQYFEAMTVDIRGDIKALEAMERRLVGKMRDMQTEVLRTFAASEGPHA